MNEIKNIKLEVNHLKREIIGLRQSEEDLTFIRKDTISRLSEECKGEECKGEVKKIKAEINVARTDVGNVRKKLRN